jgi:hypothetical protein
MTEDDALKHCHCDTEQSKLKELVLLEILIAT